MSAEQVVLHVEDDDATAYLFRLAIHESDIRACVFRVTTGEHATTFLRKQQPYEAAPKPDLVVLDLNLVGGGATGFDVLAEARSVPELNDVRVIVFTSSERESDLSRALTLGADAYLNKGTGLDAFFDAVRLMFPSDKP